jgi:FtsZ-interacting cell division protein ZipA
MTALREILIAFAVLLLAAIYLWGRRNSKQSRSSAALPMSDGTDGSTTQTPLVPSGGVTAPEIPAERLEPQITWPAAESIGGEPEVAAFAALPTAHGEPLEDAAAAPESTQSRGGPADEPYMILALRLVATVPRFSGAHLRTALEAASLQFGKYQIFHRTTESGEVVFSVASMLEPGSFDLDQMFHEQYPGIALFAQLPGALDGVSVLRELISCARKLQQTLGGVLQDDRAAPLLAPRIEQLRKEVREFEAAHPRRERSESSHP